MSETVNYTGTFFTFEGPEGSGKSTQINLLAEELIDLGHEVVVTREPGGTPIGEEIRHLLIHSSSGKDMSPEAELLLFAAARAQLVRELILPSLEAGKVVICDRFLDSTTVYQGAARSIASDPVSYINQFAVGPVTPDLTFILDVPHEESMRRVKRRATDVPDRMEEENADFYKKVRDGYLLLAGSMPERFHVVDGTRELEANREEILKTVLENL
ncbi:dTMP kinase [Pelagicoccus mobilis]|uniref:Thymidylate kinase n=1 Tax=Pelagicoccus mobilis TaxID=415221 RepID=A0A934RTV1_9BACT|nr:dTMP kinase [Pelagicoccus mobilis]MBK1877510.1 dTMP kinase [Pelagicoccus mobilis]